MDASAARLFWFVIPGVVIPAGLLVLAFRAPRPSQLTRWAQACDVTITASNEAMVRSNLGRVRRFRAVAMAPLWWLVTAGIVFGPTFPSELASSLPVLVAYLAGSLVAELTAPPPWLLASRRRWCREQFGTTNPSG